MNQTLNRTMQVLSTTSWFATARVDSPPCGIDFPTHWTTGRFSNGLNIDWIGPNLISGRLWILKSWSNLGKDVNDHWYLSIFIVAEAVWPRSKPGSCDRYWATGLYSSRISHEEHKWWLLIWIGTSCIPVESKTWKNVIVRKPKKSYPWKFLYLSFM